MNIFYLNRCPEVAAEMQCDKHVVKMIVETAQLLSTAHYELTGESPAYKPTHKNHPSAVWVRSNVLSYLWTWRHLRALGCEYERRYGKVHKTIAEHLDALREAPAPLYDNYLAIRDGFTPPPQCMPDECKRDDTVLAYLTYYNHKADEWAERGMPMRWHGETRE